MGGGGAGVRGGVFIGALKKTGNRQQGSGNRKREMLSSSSLQFTHQGNEHAADFLRKLLCLFTG